MIGSIECFKGTGEEFGMYLERIEHLFKVNKVEMNMKVSLFITLAGPQVYCTLKNLMAPDSPNDKTYDDIIKVLKSHYVPEKSEIGERFTFNKCNQQSSQTVAEYIVELRRLANTCKFGAFLDEALRDRLVCGLSSETVQKKLLSEVNLTFARACSLAQAHEMAEMQSKLLTTTNQVHHIRSRSTQSSNFKQSSVPSSSYTSKKGVAQSHSHKNVAVDKEAGSQQKSRCHRCGKQHNPETCPAKQWECFRCKRKGHTSKVCRSKNPIRLVEQAEETSLEEQHLEELYPLNKIDSANNLPHKVNLRILGKNVLFEVDTGACKTIISAQLFKENFPNVTLNSVSYKLTSVTGQVIEAMGETLVKIHHANNSYMLPLTVVNSHKEFVPLLGRNWLNSLFPDWQQYFKLGAVKALSVDNCIQVCKEEFKVVFNSDLSCPIKDYEINFKVQDNVNPIFKKPYNMPYALRPKVEEKLESLVKAGILKPVSSSNWASPIVIVHKKDGEVRICVDFRVSVNKVLIPEQYPLPTVDDIFATLSGGKVFTVLDLTGAYSQLKVKEQSQELLTINTHVGLFRYTRMTYGIASAPSIFQSVMDRILMGIPNCHCYLDDIIIAGRDLSECYELVREVLNRLQKSGVKVNLAKCKFFESSVDYLGHTIDEQGIHPTKEKLRAIIEAPEPQDLTQLRAYLGLLNYYSKFIPMLSSRLGPMYKLLRKDVEFVWTNECKENFELSKTLICQNQVLVHYDPSKPIVISCDSSSYGVGSVLSHRIDGIDKPIYFASGTLSNAEKNYSQIEREALAIIFGVKKFHKFVYGRSFILVTDHQPLKVIFNPDKGISVMAASRLVRWSLILSAYNYQIEYRKGSELKEADALSRLPLKDATDINSDVNSFNLVDEIPLSSAEVDTMSKKDPILVKVREMCLRGWPDKVDSSLKGYYSKRNEMSIEGNCLLVGNRVVIPQSLRGKVLDIIHADHLGIVKTKMLARSTVWWPGVNDDIELLISKCRTCQLTQNNAHDNLISWPKTENVWQRVHIDFFNFKGTTCLLIVDSKSKWLDVHVMRQGTDITKTVEKLKLTFSILGIPQSIVSDNGPPFNSNEFQRFCQTNGIIPLKSPPYHPQSNGLAERYVGTVKSSLNKFLMQNSNLKLEQQIVNFLFSYRNTPNASTGLCPNDLLFKFKPRTKLDMLKPSFNNMLITKSTENFIPPKLFKIGEKVLVGNLGPSYDSHIKWKEGVIMKIISGVTYLVKVDDKILYKHVNNLRHSQLDNVNTGSGVGSEIIKDNIRDQTNVKDNLERETASVHSDVTQKVGIPVSENLNINPQRPVTSSNRASEQLPLRRSARIVKPPERLNL